MILNRTQVGHPPFHAEWIPSSNNPWSDIIRVIRFGENNFRSPSCHSNDIGPHQMVDKPSPKSCSLTSIIKYPAKFLFLHTASQQCLECFAIAALLLVVCYTEKHSISPSIFTAAICAKHTFFFEVSFGASSRSKQITRFFSKTDIERILVRKKANLVYGAVIRRVRASTNV